MIQTVAAVLLALHGVIQPPSTGPRVPFGLLACAIGRG